MQTAQPQLNSSLRYVDMTRQQLMQVLLVGVMSLASGLSHAHQEQAFKYNWGLPSWVPAPSVPKDNPMSVEKVELGRHLFYDKRLSTDQTISCATCHIQAKGFTDGRSVSPGVTGELGSRSSMALVNIAYLPVLTWMNPLLNSLEVQALIPIFGTHPVEMGMAGKETQIFNMLKGDPRYRTLFNLAFPTEAAQGSQTLYSLSTLTKALASFQRTLLSFDAPYDRYKYNNDLNAISPAAKRGEALFFGERMECYHCHGGLNFTDNVKHERLPFPELGFHNTGLYNIDGTGTYPKHNQGIVETSGDSQEKGKFRTPSLRNIAVTAPYMHDGSIDNLEAVIKDHYAHAGRAGKNNKPNPLRSELLVGFQITDEEVKDLIAFLTSLTDKGFLNNPKFADPW